MVDSRVEKLAELCVHYCVDVKPKEKVVIRGYGELIGFSELAFPLINEIFKECLLSDAYPIIMQKLDVAHTFFRYAKEHQLKFVSPFEKLRAEITDVQITVLCKPNPRELANIEPSKIKMYVASKRELVEILRKRRAEGKLKGTILPYPIAAQAQEANMSLAEYEDFVYSSCLVDQEDPIVEWKKIHKQQEKICQFLNQTDEIHIVGENTDLTFNVRSRKWMNCDGKRNMPDGEVYTAPLENSAEGTIRFTFPGIYLGREVEDIKLTFKEGKVVKASAAKGGELLQQLLKIKGADRIGEVAIGTNYGITRFTKNMLFDEKMGGTIHLALGLSFPQSGGLNKSAIHWDILKDMKKDGEIYADGRLFYKNGKFLL
jgi:aminopeptidase